MVPRSFLWVHICRSDTTIIHKWIWYGEFKGICIYIIQKHLAGLMYMCHIQLYN